MDILTAVLTFFNEAGIVVIVLFLFFAFLVVVWWLGRAITHADQKRDDNTAKLVSAQIEIMTIQQGEFGKLNKVIIESLQEKNTLLEKANETNANLTNAINNLGRIFDMGQNETNETLSKMLDYLAFSKGQDAVMHDKLTQILDYLQSDKQNTLLIASLLDRFAKKLADIDGCDKEFCVQWKEALNQRLQSLDTRIEIIQEGIKNEETTNYSSTTANS